ncbi:lachesin-like [Centruroides sculpturatus]|uniref:lachesin-like n=1 Tax=Centruroides sculpturatus TaxID=218467 RepID=UPI000C6DF826|nr:lachesin-like [Centruroides sculpturatus]
MKLRVRNLRPEDFGSYTCVAKNSLGETEGTIRLYVPPMIWIPNQLIGAPLGTDVTLDCNLESHPRSVTYWTREGGVMILSNAKYDSMLLPTGIYKVQMKLRVRNLRPEDFGSYTCVAKNSLGETEGTIRLYEIPPPSSTSSSQGPEAFHAKSEKLLNGHPPSAMSRPAEKGNTVTALNPILVL